MGMVDRPAGAVDEHQPRVDPIVERLLGDEFGRKIVVEPGFHAGENPASARRNLTDERLQVYAGQCFSGYRKRREPWRLPRAEGSWRAARKEFLKTRDGRNS